VVLSPSSLEHPSAIARRKDEPVVVGGLEKRLGRSLMESVEPVESAGYG
jgi:hypothetical protein